MEMQRNRHQTLETIKRDRKEKIRDKGGEPCLLGGTDVESINYDSTLTKHIFISDLEYKWGK